MRVFSVPAFVGTLTSSTVGRAGNVMVMPPAVTRRGSAFVAVVVAVVVGVAGRRVVAVAAFAPLMPAGPGSPTGASPVTSSPLPSASAARRRRVGV